jgi:CSLREA domain-containing protein
MQRCQLGWLIAALSMASLITPCTQAQEPPPTINFTVNTVADLIDDNAGNAACHTASNTCSLRAAIMEANRSSVVGARILINLPAGIYRLMRTPSGINGDDTGDLNMTAPGAGQSIIILGAGAASTIIDANYIDRALRIQGGRVATIADVTIRNGLAAGDNGGGILIRNSTLSIEDSVIEANHSELGGGGVVNDSGVLNIVRSTIRSNTAEDQGGGVFGYGRTTIRDSALYGNGAKQGGGIQNTAELYVINTTLSGNYAYADGGGIYNSAESFLYNTSIVDNDANHQSVMFGSGGGVFTVGSRFVIFNALIVGNTNHGSYPWDCNGNLEAYGSNLLSVVGAAQNCTIPNLFGWALMARSALGPLRDNGGPSATHALLAGSLAINATSIQGCVGPADIALTTDQRGLPRGLGSACDVGAFEYGAGVTFESGFE